MATELEQQFIDAFLSSENPFRESVVYTVSGGTAKTIYAVVKRGGTVRTSGRADTTPAGYDCELLISPDSTSGIATVKIGEDTVAITAPEFAETNVYNVSGIIAKTAMAWHLGLKA